MSLVLRKKCINEPIVYYYKIYPLLFLLRGDKEKILTSCVSLDKSFNVLGTSFLICEMRRWHYIILVSPLVLKLYDLALEIMETF